MTDPDWNWGETLNNNAEQNESFIHNNFQPLGRLAKSQESSNNVGSSTPNYFIPSVQPNQQWNSTISQSLNANTYFEANNLKYDNQANQAFSSYPPIQQNVQPDFNVFPQQFVSDPLLNTARQIGGQFAEQQREKFAKYLSSFQLKYYFAVDTRYVGKKLGIIIFPFIHRDWTNKFGQNGEAMAAKDDLNAPDLYIPSMAFITYVLIAGFVFGLQKRFSPEKLGMLTTNALFYLFLENVLVFVTKYVLNISQSLNVWHALSYSSYKFVGMVICLILFLIGGSSAYYIALTYCIFTTVFFLLRSLKTFILDMGYSNDGGRKRKVYLLLSITVLQSIIMWILTSSVTTYMPDQYDFAKLAINLAKSGAGSMAQNNIPILPDGEVDYEALLKIP